MWDKKGDNLTYKWLRLLTEQQENVFRKYRGTWNESENTKVTSKRLSNIDLGKPVNLVVVFTGGNNPSVKFSKSATEELIQTIRNNFGKDVEIVIGAAPPARTGNPETVNKVFGRMSHPENYKARRIAMADAIATTANNMGVKAINPNTAGFLSDDTTSGDGIHLRGTDAENFAKEIAAQIAGKGVGVIPATASGPEKTSKTFSGERLSTSQLRSMTAKDVVEYAKARSSACRNMGYLSIDSKGKPVANIQNTLKEKGYEIKDPEGQFGVNTLLNVIKFQIKSGIRVDGCVGPETMGSLGMASPTKASIGEPSTASLAGLKKPPREDVVKTIINVAAEVGFDPVAAITMAMIESGLNPLSNIKGGRSYKGLYQFGSQFRNDWARYGLDWERGDQFNAEASARSFMKLMKDKLRKYFPEIKDHRNIPEDLQHYIYVMWQQGSPGAASIKRAAERKNRFTSRQTYENTLNNWYRPYPYSAGKTITDPKTGKTIDIGGKSRKQMIQELNPARTERGIKPLRIGNMSYIISKQTFNDQIMRPSDFLNKWDRTFAAVRKKAKRRYGGLISAGPSAMPTTPTNPKNPQIDNPGGAVQIANLFKESV
jgi:peptidoglycan hydrolase-like protein with peptidoglycan-binding domain